MSVLRVFLSMEGYYVCNPSTGTAAIHLGARWQISSPHSKLCRPRDQIRHRRRRRPAVRSGAFSSWFRYFCSSCSRVVTPRDHRRRRNIGERHAHRPRPRGMIVCRPPRRPPRPRLDTAAHDACFYRWPEPLPPLKKYSRPTTYVGDHLNVIT